MKVALIISIVSILFIYTTIGLTLLMILSLSSGSIKFGTSPVFSKLFTSSKKLSAMI